MSGKRQLSVMRVLAVELGPTDTTVNSVNPGWTCPPDATGERAGSRLLDWPWPPQAMVEQSDKW
jgi:NAD(P)-dependent dehydrogenase (short-subunit alcohol dehydrogenase family)